MIKSSTYNKIYEILNNAEKNIGNISEFAKIIQNINGSFVYYKKDGTGVVREYPCDLSTIRKKIRFCIQLGLLGDEKNCNLTDDGRNALFEGRFDLQIQQSVILYLEKKDLKFSDIERAIDKLILPTPGGLYQFLSTKLSEDKFRTCLLLLSECGEKTGQQLLKKFRKKLYLTDDKLEKARRSLKDL
jgi:hypothetical protein